MNATKDTKSEVSELTVTGVSKSFGDKSVLSDLSWEAKHGEFIVLVGPSGCGKSTMLRCIAGLEICDNGKICIGQRNITHLPPKDRNIAMVFQDYALYPHKNVYENIAFGLRMRKLAESEIDARVREAATKLDLIPYLKRKPAQLSGGQRQRVAIGRAIVRKPAVFLFDEPLSNLDAKLRTSMRLTIAKLQKELQTTVVYVTHDQVEAMTLADRIVVLEQGIIQQVGTPLDLYYHPHNLFVGTFIGSPEMNLIEGRLEVTSSKGSLVRSYCFVSDKGFKVQLPQTQVAKIPPTIDHDMEVVWGIRPENLRVPKGGPSESPQFDLEVVVSEPLGPSTLALCNLGPHEVRVSLPEPTRPVRGDTVKLEWRSRNLYMFDKASGLSLVQ